MLLTDWSLNHVTSGEVVVPSCPAVLTGPSRFDHYYDEAGNLRTWSGEVVDPAPEGATGVNLIGKAHRHVWTVPFYGHLMCKDFYCGSVRTGEGHELTDEQRERIRTELRTEYGG